MISDDGSMYKNSGEATDPHKDVVVMPYSSGTTGPPKGVCLSHFNLVANCVQIGAKDVLPFFHIYSMELIMLLNMRLGNKIVTLPKFEPEMYIKALVQYKPTLLHP